MEKVIIIVNAEVTTAGTITLASPATNTMVTALKRAISANSPTTLVEVMAAASAWSKAFTLRESHEHPIYCPLTIDLPYQLPFPGQKIYQACKNIQGQRHWVEETLGYKTSMADTWLGDLWLPIILTPSKTLYGEVIGEGVVPNSYYQPINLPQKVYKSLHFLGDQLLKSLEAVPSVYLLQFRLLETEIVFDRLWPFPAAPAIASLGHPQGDLFAHYWNCISQQPRLNQVRSRKSVEA